MTLLTVAKLRLALGLLGCVGLGMKVWGFGFEAACRRGGYLGT